MNDSEELLTELPVGNPGKLLRARNLLKNSRNKGSLLVPMLDKALRKGGMRNDY